MPTSQRRELCSPCASSVCVQLTQQQHTQKEPISTSKIDTYLAQVLFSQLLAAVVRHKANDGVVRSSTVPHCLEWYKLAIAYPLQLCGIYRVGQKSKLLHFVHIFAKYWPIFKIFSAVESVRNLLFSGIHITRIMSQHYLVKHKYPKTYNLYRWTEDLMINF